MNDKGDGGRTFQGLVATACRYWYSFTDRQGYFITSLDMQVIIIMIYCELSTLNTGSFLKVDGPMQQRDD